MTAGPLTLEDLERLEAVARRARDVDQRPWRQVRGHDLWTAVYSGHAPGRMVVDCATKEDGALIAALDPSTVLRLVAALRSVMAERDALRESLRAERTRTLPCGHRMGWCNCGGI